MTKGNYLNAKVQLNIAVIFINLSAVIAIFEIIQKQY